LPTLPEGSIAATDIWKRFRADPTANLLRERIGRWRRQLRGQKRGWRWALRDVDFVVQPGDAVGLVGTNGSGKSTLLKILCGVMYPHSGRIDVAGRVGALIEVRAGLHPELSGRENTHLYGTLLGLSRRQVAERFDEIVEFAQLEDAVDRQLKFYSSGMQMRLGFGVAAFLEPEVLLVDEVLAVGDATFQQRCIDRMRTVRNQGTTLVFVSHDLATVEGVCERVVWLNDGAVVADGPVRDVLGAYREGLEKVAETGAHTGPTYVREVTVRGPDGYGPRTQEPCDITIRLHNEVPTGGKVVLGISEGTATPIFLVEHEISMGAESEVELRCTLDRLPLAQGRYFLWAGVFGRRADLMTWQPISHFDVIGPALASSSSGIVRLAPVHVPASWDLSAV
jgi:ABC-type polysaccharide/polyol phosphate transport system ATPase subunit